MKMFSEIEGFLYNHTRSEVVKIDFHLHDAYEIYYLISGDVNYFVENKIYDIKQGDIVITNKYEIHKPSFNSDKTYERIYIQFGNTIPDRYSTADFDLLHCFNSRHKGDKNKINLNAEQKIEFNELMAKLELTGNNKNPSDTILRNTYFVQLLVLLNKAFSEEKERCGQHVGISTRLYSVLDYINENLQGDLSLEVFEQKFFINKYYFSRLFKKNTGLNLQQYIMFKRLARAKELLANGASVTEACYSSGFNDYSNFYRLFKRVIGINPGEYKKKSII